MDFSANSEDFSLHGSAATGSSALSVNITVTGNTNRVPELKSPDNAPDVKNKLGQFINRVFHRSDSKSPEKDSVVLLSDEEIQVQRDQQKNALMAASIAPMRKMVQEQIPDLINVLQVKANAFTSETLKYLVETPHAEIDRPIGEAKTSYLRTLYTNMDNIARFSGNNDEKKQAIKYIADIKSSGMSLVALAFAKQDMDKKFNALTDQQRENVRTGLLDIANALKDNQYNFVKAAEKLKLKFDPVADRVALS